MTSQLVIFKMLYRCGLTLLCLMFLVSCGGNHRSAPVRNLSVEPVNKKLWKSGRYKVQKNDSLYSISFRFGIDFQQLAKINNIKIPYTIYPGQVLRLRYDKKPYKGTKPVVIASGSTVVSKNKNAAKQQNKTSKNTTTYSKSKGQRSNSSFDNKKKVTAWRWPVKNNTSKKFSKSKGDQQGINIAGSLGEPIRATADGRVVYSGNGLVGYGNLIIIKHSQSYLSAYAHNEKLLVKEKDIIKTGQIIAKMGKNDMGQVQLHFEIRYQGRPVNPLKYLPSID